MPKDENHVFPDISAQELRADDKALRALIEGQRKATRLYEERNDAGRQGVIAAVSTMLEFMWPYQRMTSDHWVTPLMMLQSALLGLEEGDVATLLRPHQKPRGGGLKASAAREIAEAGIAATAHRLRKTGLNAKEADAKVAAVCRAAGMKRERKGKDAPGQEPEITARTVCGWRARIARDVGRHSVAAQVLDQLSQSWTAPDIAKAIAVKGVEAARKDFLDDLRRSLIQTRASEH